LFRAENILQGFAGIVSEVQKSFFWVYFNTAKARYDTLRPDGVFRVKEGKKASTRSSVSSEDAFFGLIEKAGKYTLEEEKDEPKLPENTAPKNTCTKQ
jgi:hypothetical protein